MNACAILNMPYFFFLNKIYSLIMYTSERETFNQSCIYLVPCFPPDLGLTKTRSGQLPPGVVIWNELWPCSHDNE